MGTVIRDVIQIDEELCDGCGACIPSCPEGALQVIDGKVRLVKQSYCDGLGACLGDCPQGALRVVKMEVEAYDEAGVIAHIEKNAPDMLEKHMAHLRAHGMGGTETEAEGPRTKADAQLPVFAACPGSEVRLWDAPAQDAGKQADKETGQQEETPRLASELRQWPVQLHLVPTRAPYFQNADLTLVADCVPFAVPNFHSDYLKGSAVAVGCPKLDDGQAYIEKVTQILQQSDVRSLKVLYMEVPCCRGLVFIAQEALRRSGKDIPFSVEMINIG